MFTLSLHHKLQPYHFYPAKVVNFFLLQKLSHFYYAPWQNFTIKLINAVVNLHTLQMMLKINKQTSVQKNSFSFSCVQILQDVKREREKNCYKKFGLCRDEKTCLITFLVSLLLQFSVHCNPNALF